jgi:hypothetical protein
MKKYKSTFTHIINLFHLIFGTANTNDVLCVRVGDHKDLDSTPMATGEAAFRIGHHSISYGALE